MPSARAWCTIFLRSGRRLLPYRRGGVPPNIHRSVDPTDREPLARPDAALSQARTPAHRVHLELPAAHHAGLAQALGHEGGEVRLELLVELRPGNAADRHRLEMPAKLGGFGPRRLQVRSLMKKLAELVTFFAALSPMKVMPTR